MLGQIYDRMLCATKLSKHKSEIALPAEDAQLSRVTTMQRPGRLLFHGCSIDFNTFYVGRAFLDHLREVWSEKGRESLTLGMCWIALCNTCN